jgi:signal transduction histidine kinase
MIRPTIFWMNVTKMDREPIEAAKRLYDAHVIEVSPSGLARQALAAVARGPVICIAGTDREAGQALGLGIDEVLRMGEVTTESLAGAVSRARSRAAVRASPEYRHALLDQDVEAAAATLGATLGERLEVPLAMASVDCAAVTAAMNCLVEVDDQFVAWTTLVAPSEQLRRLIARRLTAPTAPELKGVLTRLRASIGRAESLVRLLRDLSRLTDTTESVAVPILLADMLDVMRDVIEPWAEISIQADSGTVTSALRTTVVVAIGVLLANALDSIRAASRGRGHIVVRAFEEEDAVIIEILDDGQQVPSDLRPDLLEQQFDQALNRRGRLPDLRDRLRRAGGDLLVDSDVTGTTVRVFLPSARVADGPGLAPKSVEVAPNSSRKADS